MSNNFSHRIRDALASFPWERVLYPLGVGVVTALLVVSFFATQKFFTTSIRRVTTVSVSRLAGGDAFHLATYRSIAPVIGLLPAPAEAVPPVAKDKTRLAIRNAQTHNDRVALATSTLTADGWIVSDPSEKKEENIPYAVATTIAAKESQANAVTHIVRLLLREGFVVKQIAPLAATDAYDVVITLGAY